MWASCLCIWIILVVVHAANPFSQYNETISFTDFPLKQTLVEIEVKSYNLVARMCSNSICSDDYQDLPAYFHRLTRDSSIKDVQVLFNNLASVPAFLGFTGPKKKRIMRKIWVRLRDSNRIQPEHSTSGSKGFVSLSGGTFKLQ